MGLIFDRYAEDKDEGGVVTLVVTKAQADALRYAVSAREGNFAREVALAKTAEDRHAFSGYLHAWQQLREVIDLALTDPVRPRREE